MERYTQKMRVRTFDIEAGKLITIIHEIDAKELGVFPLDRIEIKNPKNGKRITTVVDTTTTMLCENEIGLFEDVQNALGIKPGKKTRLFVEVKASPQPESVSFIKKKIRGETLNDNEIKQIVKDIASNKLSEIEASAFMTAVFIFDYSLDETVAMINAIVDNGQTLKLSRGPVLDKHSIGGVNGRTTMIVVPIIAAAGGIIPKTSSRSITSAAGTADSMEVLADVCLSMQKIKKVTEKTGGIIAWGGAVDLAPADDKIIKIEHPLSLDPRGQVIASVIGKKASVGAQFLVIDIPVGPYAKVKTLEKAEEMAKRFIEVCKRMRIKAEVMITDGNEPWGKAFGSALEAKYVLEILEGKFFDNLAEKSCELAGVLLELSGKAKKGKGKETAKNILESGKALEKMKQIIRAQGPRILRSEDVPKARFVEKIRAKGNFEIGSINVKTLIKIARIAGAPADKLAGVFLRAESGQELKKGAVLFEIHAENKQKLELAKRFSQKNNPFILHRTVLEKID